MNPQELADHDQSGMQYMKDGVNADAALQNVRVETLAQLNKLGSDIYASLLVKAMKNNGDKVFSAYELIAFIPKDDPIHARWLKDMEAFQRKYILESIPLLDKETVATIIAYLSKQEIDTNTFNTLRKLVQDANRVAESLAPAELFECDLCGDKYSPRNFVPQEIVLVRTSGHRDFLVCSECEPDARLNGYFEPLNEDDQCIDCDNKDCQNK